MVHPEAAGCATCWPPKVVIKPCAVSALRKVYATSRRGEGKGLRSRNLGTLIAVCGYFLHNSHVTKPRGTQKSPHRAASEGRWRVWASSLGRMPECPVVRSLLQNGQCGRAPRITDLGSPATGLFSICCDGRPFALAKDPRYICNELAEAKGFQHKLDPVQLGAVALEFIGP